MSTEATTLPPPRVFHPDVMVTLLVGPDEQRMAVHSEFLTQDSRFFQAALKEEWLNGEGQSREIRLPDESPVYMAYYIEHMFGLALPTRVLTEKSQCSPIMAHHFKLLAELYVLGERRLDAKYRNLIVRELLRLVTLRGRSPNCEFANIIYRGTTKGSPARCMMVAAAMGCQNGYWSQDVNDDALDVDAEFWRDLSKGLLKKIATHELVGVLRSVPMKVEDYLVSEDA